MTFSVAVFLTWRVIVFTTLRLMLFVTFRVIIFVKVIMFKYLYLTLHQRKLIHSWLHRGNKLLQFFNETISKYKSLFLFSSSDRAVVEKYLLEKSRLVSQEKDER